MIALWWVLVGVQQAARLHAQVSPPVVDHHQHLFSPELSRLIGTDTTLNADKLIALLDSAGIRRALVLSTAYSWSNPSRNVANDYEHVRADNDWTAAQVARYPDRLRAFCSVSPVRDYALAEIARCAANPLLRTGLKLHIGNSAADYHKPQDVEKPRQVFRAANAHHMAIVIHMRASISKHLAYGRAEAQIFYDSILPSAPDVPVQIAHLAGAGGYDSTTDAAISVFVDAIARKDPRARNLWFDVTTVTREATPETLKLIAGRIRQLGLDCVLYGSDAAAGGNLAPREAWADFLRLPLTPDEFLQIANNVAPYMRDWRQMGIDRDSLLGAALVRLRPGTTIRIHSTAPRLRVEGGFLGSTPSTVTMMVGPQSAEYSRSGIDSLWVQKRATGTGAIVGAIPGAIAGTVLGLVANALCADDGADSCPEAIPLLGLGGAAAGALLGAVVGSFIPKWQRRLP